jgi:hypothetical protein
LASTEPVGAQTGPSLTYSGVSNALGNPLDPTGYTPQGDPIFHPANGTGFFFVIEGRRGSSGLPVGESTFDAVARPDLQVQLSNHLGNGNPEVCGMSNDGVPASGTGDFAPGQSVTDALNDFACRFAVATSPGESCLVDAFGEGFFAGGSATTTQFCSALIGPALAFPDGETVVSFRLRDTGGNVGQTGRIIVQIGSVPTPTPSPTGGSSTATRSATRTATRTPSSATATPTSSATRTATAPATHTITAPAPSATSTSPLATATATAPPDLTTTPEPSPCDVDRNGVVDDADLATVIRAIFSTSYSEAADVNGIPGVTAADIVALLQLRIQQACT